MEFFTVWSPCSNRCVKLRGSRGRLKFGRVHDEEVLVTAVLFNDSSSARLSVAVITFAVLDGESLSSDFAVRPNINLLGGGSVDAVTLSSP